MSQQNSCKTLIGNDASRPPQLRSCLRHIILILHSYRTLDKKLLDSLRNYQRLSWRWLLLHYHPQLWSVWQQRRQGEAYIQQHATWTNQHEPTTKHYMVHLSEEVFNLPLEKHRINKSSEPQRVHQQCHSNRNEDESIALNEYVKPNLTKSTGQLLTFSRERIPWPWHGFGWDYGKQGVGNGDRMQGRLMLKSP